jgi:hypothetical protein
MRAEPLLTSDVIGLTKVAPLSRRGFMTASAAVTAGYTLAAGPVRADVIKTETDGLSVGEVKIKVADGEMRLTKGHCGMCWRGICAAFERSVALARRRWRMSAASTAPFSVGSSGPNEASRLTTLRASLADSKLKPGFCWMTVLSRTCAPVRINEQSKPHFPALLTDVRGYSGSRISRPSGQLLDPERTSERA